MGGVGGPVAEGERFAVSLCLHHGGLEVRVAASVLVQVVATHEALVTDGTDEPLLTCMCSEVSRQLIGSREAFPAAGPGTREGSLACMRSQMCLEVGALAVDFVAARVVALVESFVFSYRVVSLHTLCASPGFRGGRRGAVGTPSLGLFRGNR